MNNLLQIKGSFNYKDFGARPIFTNIPSGKFVETVHLLSLSNDIKMLIDYWKDKTLINGALVSAFYNTVVAKSNRIKGLLTLKGENPNIYVRGSRFSDDEHPKHIFTYYVTINILQQTFIELRSCYDYVLKNYGDIITHDDIEKINKRETAYSLHGINKTKFVKIIVDSFYVGSFGLSEVSEEINQSSLVSLYKTDIDVDKLLKKIGINIVKEERMLNETTLRLYPNEFNYLKDVAPYLIAMQTHDISKLSIESLNNSNTNEKHTIPEPTNEPIIGVIDTIFDKNAYFYRWVDDKDCVTDDIEKNEEDKFHGTAVTSLIVDGPTLNPHLQDFCGRFRVKHFGVATKGMFSSFTVLKEIRKAVADNPQIKVWNLSLGSVLPISNNFMSLEAAELDRIQCEYDVIFVVAGTNKKKQQVGQVVKIGAPADSLNSIVINSVNIDGKAASYHRVGPVLSFFHKPDVSFYGGDDDKKIMVNWSYGDIPVQGTSFAAPWIARKLAFLIHKMGLTREIAKALIIDSAAGWNRRDDLSHSIGYGIVPIDIHDILQSKDDEIKFYISGQTKEYETYRYDIPVPVANGVQPFYAKATLCYFPSCSRDQGVDYTDTEIDLHFGRVMEVNSKSKIKPIDNNKQGSEGLNIIYEEDARKLYRKWDNVKHISEIIKSKPIGRKLYGVGNWGIKLETKERLKIGKRAEETFGMVVTLKEMFGKNRYDDFIKLCNVRGVLAIPLDIENHFDIYAKAEETVEFE